MTDPTVQMMARARLGTDIEVFKTTEPYKFLMDCARQRYDAAIAELIDTNPANAGAIAQAQADARVFLSLQSWIDGAIQDGGIAHRELRARDYTE
jgi:hypothetical protein